MKFARKMMLVPYKENDDKEFNKIITEKKIETPVKLDIINKRIKTLKTPEKVNEDLKNDSKEIKKFLNKKTNKTLEKLNELNKILNKRLLKIPEIINKKQERLIKRPLKRKLNLSEINEKTSNVTNNNKVASIETIKENDLAKKRKLKSLTVTKSENINFIPSELMEYSDSDDEGVFKRSAIRPLLSNNKILTRNNIKNWESFK